MSPEHSFPPVKVFYSYAHEDEDLRDKLAKHLKSLERQGLIENWHDRCITGGNEWANEIDEHLESAELILLLISADFTHSDYCFDVEMKRAMVRHDANEARVVPIFLREVDCEGLIFGKLQGLPKDALPVTSWPSQDAAFTDIARGIRKVVSELREQGLKPSIPAKPEVVTDPGELRQRYLALMAEEWRALRLAGLDPNAGDPNNRKPMTLEQVYVSLDTTTPWPKKEDDERDKPLSAVEALCHAPEGRMLLLGQPGSGKSTFARHLVLTQTQVLRGSWTLDEHLPGWQGAPRWPVFVSLARLAAALPGDAETGSAQQIEDFIRSEIDRHADIKGYALLQDLQGDSGGLVVFDGLDEVPGHQRKLIKEAVSCFAAVYRDCRILVTCRTHSYRQDEGWHLDWPGVHELALFDDEKINAFINAWFEVLAQGNVSTRNKADTLKIALAPDDHRGLRELAGTPLMLTVIAIVHTHKDLPGSRVEVYRECVDILLLRWHGKRTERAEAVPSLVDQLREYEVSEGKLIRGLQAMAFAAHDEASRQRTEGVGRGLVREGLIRDKLTPYLKEVGVRLFLDYCRHANGLLLAAGVVQPAHVPPDAPVEAVYAFPHLSFLEYLAACHLRSLRSIEARDRAGNPAWREVLRFLGQSLCYGRGDDLDRARILLEQLCPERQPRDDADWRRVWLAGDLLPEMRREAVDEQLPESLDKRIVRRLVALLESRQALADAPQDRAAAGRVLARVGDPRPGVGVREGLPELLWVPIPGVEELRLGDGDWSESEPAISLKPFYLAAYPVTVAQYRVFVEAGGYREDDYWTKAGRKELGNRSAPYLWGNPNWTVANHPVVGVTWYEAVVFCRWLTERLRDAGRLPRNCVVRLPTEAEWEWAARGPENRNWPWGNEWTDGRCNSEEVGLNRTSAVGGFPAGAGDWQRGKVVKLPELKPRGELIHDLVGNVFDWCSTRWQEDYPLPNLKTEWTNKYLEGDDWRIVRGGGYFSDKSMCRGAFRDWINPDLRLTYWGFRCCVSTSSL